MALGCGPHCRVSPCPSKSTTMSGPHALTMARPNPRSRLLQHGRSKKQEESPWQDGERGKGERRESSCISIAPGPSQIPRFPIPNSRADRDTARMAWHGMGGSGGGGGIPLFFVFSFYTYIGMDWGARGWDEPRHIPGTKGGLCQLLHSEVCLVLDSRRAGSGSNGGGTNGSGEKVLFERPASTPKYQGLRCPSISVKYWNKNTSVLGRTGLLNDNVWQHLGARLPGLSGLQIAAPHSFQNKASRYDSLPHPNSTRCKLQCSFSWRR